MVAEQLWGGVGRYYRLSLHHGARGRLPCLNYGLRTPGEPAPPSPLHALPHSPHLFHMLTGAFVAMCMQVRGAAGAPHVAFGITAMFSGFVVVALVAGPAECVHHCCCMASLAWGMWPVACGSIAIASLRVGASWHFLALVLRMD